MATDLSSEALNSVDGDWRGRCREDDLVGRGQQPPPDARLPGALLAAATGRFVLDDIVFGALELARDDVTAAEAVRQVHLLGEAVAAVAVHEADAGARLVSALGRAIEVLVDRYLTRIEERARRDSMTMLPNREMLSIDVERAIAIATDGNATFSLAFCDLNGLKVANDDFGGHRVGDEYIRSFAERVHNRARTFGGQAYRMGAASDEFVVVFDDTAPGIAEVMDALKSDQDVQPFCYGTAVWPADWPTLDQLLAAADGRMYAMKRATTREERDAEARAWIRTHRDDLGIPRNVG